MLPKLFRYGMKMLENADVEELNREFEDED